MNSHRKWCINFVLNNENAIFVVPTKAIKLQCLEEFPELTADKITSSIKFLRNKEFSAVIIDEIT